MADAAFSASDFATPAGTAPGSSASMWSPDDFAPHAPAAPMSGAANDTIWSSVKSTGARILNAVGYGAQQGWGSEPIGMAPETEKFFKQAGLFHDYQDTHSSFLKSFNDAVTRPVIESTIRAGAAAFQTVTRAGSAAISAVGTGAEQGAREAQNSDFAMGRYVLAPVLGAVSEGAGYLQAGGGFELAPGGVHAPEAAAASEAVAGERVLDANRARAAGVVGEGEAGFYDATEPTPEDVQARANAAAEAGLDQVPQPLPPAPDIHELARRVDPETFERYDELALQRDAARDELVRLGEERGNAPEIAVAQERIDAILGKVNGVEDRLTNVQTERLAAARDQLELARTADTPAMIEARNRLMGADFEMRDMAPQVSEAYRHAADMLPEGTLERAPEPKGAETAGKGAEEPAREPEQPATRVLPPEAASEVASAETAPPNVLGGETLGEPHGEAASSEGVAQEGTAKPAGRPTTANMKSVEGTGELKTRSLAEGVEAKAIEDGLTETFGDLPEYRALNMAEQASGVSKLIAEDYERARAVAMGERQPPKGLLPESVFVGVEKHALATGDIETLRQLGTRSRLATAATTMGQRIRALGERDKASPVGAIQDVQTAREAALKAKNIDIEAEKASIASEIKAEMKKAATVKQDAWANFIASVKCGEA